MSNPKARTLPDVFSMFFIMCAVYGIDIFLFKSDLTIVGTPLFAWFVGLAVLVMYIRGARSSRKLLGISFKNEKITAGILYGLFLSVIPMVAVIATEWLCFRFINPADFSLSFTPPNYAYAGDVRQSTSAMVYTVALLAASAFNEFFFRGFMLKTLHKSISFARANLLQSAMAMSFTLVLVVRNVIFNVYDDKSNGFIVLVAVFSIVNEMLAGIKRGMMTRVSGATYIALVDNYIYSFFTACIIVTEGYTQGLFVPHMLAIQAISFVLTLIYYSISMKKINAKKARREIREQAELAEIEARRKAEEAKSINKRTDGIEEISPDSFKKIVRDGQHSGRARHSTEEQLQTKKTIEDVLTTPLEDSSSDEVNEILAHYTKERSHHHKHRSREITADFNTDDFLESYGRADGKKKHHHHHAEQSKARSTEPEKKPAQKKEKQTLAKKPKLTFAQKLQSLGGIDDSSSNDLI